MLAFKGDKRLLNPLDLEQWEFYVAETSRIQKEFGDRKKLSLARVQGLSRAYRVDELPDAVASLKVTRA